MRLNLICPLSKLLCLDDMTIFSIFMNSVLDSVDIFI